MSRLIDADALWMDIIHSMDYCDDILEIIERQPTVEQEPSDVARDIATIIENEKDMRVVLIATDMVFRFFQKHPEQCPHELRSTEEITEEGDETVRTIRQKCIVCGYEKIHVVRTKNN